MIGFQVLPLRESGEREREKNERIPLFCPWAAEAGPSGSSCPWLHCKWKSDLFSPRARLAKYISHCDVSLLPEELQLTLGNQAQLIGQPCSFEVQKKYPMSSCIHSSKVLHKISTEVHVSQIVMVPSD